MVSPWQKQNLKHSSQQTLVGGALGGGSNIYESCGKDPRLERFLPNRRAVGVSKIFPKGIIWALLPGLNPGHQVLHMKCDMSVWSIKVDSVGSQLVPTYCKFKIVSPAPPVKSNPWELRISCSSQGDYCWEGKKRCLTWGIVFWWILFGCTNLRNRMIFLVSRYLPIFHPTSKNSHISLIYLSSKLGELISWLLPMQLLCFY
jgi:hypothetical protein